MTFLVGANNSGKSNILRILAILFNNAFDRINDADDLSDRDKNVNFSLDLSASLLNSQLDRRPNARGALKLSKRDHIKIYMNANHSGLRINPKSPDFVNVFGDYISNTNGSFLNDFNQSGSNNADILLRDISFEKIFQGTTFLPNLRFITLADQEPPQFIKWQMPGETLAFGTVIKRLASMDRPDPENRHLRDHKKQIEDFMAFCLEKSSVNLEVPESKKTILVSIDGDERPIDSFGTGVEQLLMIGLASIGFPGKLVLIDEPELNLHPRAQKRIINYLNRLPESQFVIATHSAAILDAAEADIIQVTYSEQTTKSRTLVSNRDRYNAVRDLGHSPSDIVQTKYAIWVEGPSDRIYIIYWISLIDNSLTEGIDYTVLFYGGKILSHHSFEDIESDLVKAVSLSRSFAVVIDSDRQPGKPNINKTKSRVRGEIEREGGFCWITDGREIENYVSLEIVTKLAVDMDGVTPQEDKRGQVLDPARANKVEFARKAVEMGMNEWPLDLKRMVSDLVERINLAR